MGSLNWSLFLCLLCFHYSFAYFTLSKAETEALERLDKEDAMEALKNLDIFGEDYGVKWLVLPDGNGVPQIALLVPETQNTTDKGNGEEKIIFEKYSVEDMPKHVILALYSGNYPDGKTFDIESLKSLNFDSSKPTKFIIHGWKANNESLMMTAIRDAYRSKQDANVISVDWGSISQDIIYPNAAGAAEVVGMHVASAIDSLAKHHNIKHQDIHIVGHSLGAHVSGFIGSNTKERIGRITGLDPALPGFQIGGPERRLDPSDANFVDVIHTSCGTLGMSINVGHADFFPNGGSAYQPGCPVPMLFPMNLVCSHARSHEYFAESIKHADFKAVECSDWEHFKNNECEKNQINLMGENATPKSKGMFFLKTLSSKPFAMDLDGIFF